MIALTEAVLEFAIARRADGLAASTLRWYRAMLQPMLDALGTVYLDRVTTAQLRAYVNTIRDRYKPVTATDHLVAARAFWTWATLEYTIPNPMVKIRQPRRPRPMPKAIDTGDLRKLFEVCGETPVGYRDRAMIVMLADTGIRAAGLLGLTPDDLDFARRRATVTEKGGKSRSVPFTSYTSRCLSLWLKKRPANAETVFCTNVGRRLTYWGLNTRLRFLARKAGITGRVNAHSFRHFAAREYLNQGGDLATLAALLGHADVSTTASHYALYTDDEIAERHRQHSPLKTMFPVKSL